MLALQVFLNFCLKYYFKNGKECQTLPSQDMFLIPFNLETNAVKTNRDLDYYFIFCILHHHYLFAS